MYELPDEIWKYILDFTLDWKRSHKEKINIISKSIICKRTIYERWTHFPPWSNTNDIIRDEYILGVRDISWAPPPNLELISITYNPNGNSNGGWWCGYGWHYKPIKVGKRIRFL